MGQRWTESKAWSHTELGHTSYGITSALRQEPGKDRKFRHFTSGFIFPFICMCSFRS